MAADHQQEGRQLRLDRIVEVLELTAASEEGILQMDVAAGLGIPASTAYRIMSEMRRVGILEANNGRGRHRLTKRFTELGSLAERNRKMFATVERIFSRLSDELSETTYLVRMNGRVISLAGYSKPLNTTGLHPGNAFPIHASAAGKILWSYQSEEILGQELKRPHLKFQDKTHVTEEEIRQDLCLTRQQGYGIHDEEWDKGIYTMAVPLFLGRKTPVMAMGVMAMKDRLLSAFTQDDVLQRLLRSRDLVEKKLMEV